MNLRRTLALIVLSNLLFAGLLAGAFYATGLASAGPAPQEGGPLHIPPVSFQFPLHPAPPDGLKDTTPLPFVAEPAVPGMLYQSTSAVNFHPRTQTDGVKTAYGGSQCIYASDGTATEPVTANVYVNQGAILTEIKVYWWRGGTGDNLSMTLKQTDMFGNVADLATVTTDSDTGYNSNVATLNPSVQVDNQNFSYSLSVYLNHLGSGMRLCGARVGYTVGGNWAVVPDVQK